METTLVRGFVLFLALTGFGASSVSTRVSSSSAVRSHDTGGGTIPGLCPPSSGSVCGMQ